MVNAAVAVVRARPAFVGSAGAPGRNAVALLAGMLLLALLPAVVSGFWVFVATSSLVYAIGVLSVVVLHRASSAITLCQATFMGVGAYATAWLYTDVGWPFLAAAVVGVAAPVPVGALVAVPALRLRLKGLELAVLTLTVGFAGTSLVFGSAAPFRIGDIGASLEPRPAPLGIDLTDATQLWLVSLVVTGTVCLAVAAVLRGRLGSSWDAIRAGDAVAAACGIDVGRLTVAGFATSAGIAGVAGVLLLTLQSQVTAASFDTSQSVLLVVVAMVAGIDRLRAAAAGGLVLGLGQQVFPTFGLQGDWLNLAFGTFVVVAVVARNRRSGARG